MKIEFNTSSANLNADIEKTEKSTTVPSEKKAKNSGYIVDISGTVMDDAAYGKELKKAQEVMQDAGLQDVALQRDYMAVMSNSMSSEDFAKLQEEGYSPAHMEIETSVTLLDRIKATLAEAGVDIAGFTDKISDEQLEKITGSVSIANEIKSKLQEQDLPVTEENIGNVKKALDQAMELTGLSEGSMRYMLSNDLEPTIEDLYKAEYSIKGDANKQTRGYYAKKADSFDWDQLNSQMEEIIEKAGLEVSKETMDRAKWMIEAGIPLTEETMLKMDKLKSIQFSIDSNILLNAIVKSIADGKASVKADLSAGDEKSILQQAVAIKETVNSISEDAVKMVIRQEEEFSIENLDRAQKELSAHENQNTQDLQDSYELVAAQRVLEETRLRMTVEANIKLLKSNYAIETTGMNELVEKLKEAERSIYQTLFKQENESLIDGKIEKIKEADTLFNELPYLPASTIGRMFITRDKLTLSTVYQEGKNQKALYDRMGESYEALGTAPRRDMGDRIQKAFRNVDSILKDLNMETTEINQRAVRILGYNSMEISSSSIEEVKKADLALNRLIEKMTPARTIELIRNGENPLDEDIYQLVDKINQENVNEETDQYSEYLWKLEKNNEISEEEKNAYIGIYRLLHQIEKNEKNVIGRVIQSDKDMTLRNLLSAVRSNKARGMNVSVSDEYGVLEDLKTNQSSISKQIDAAYEQKQYYQSLSKNTLDQITPEKLRQVQIDLNSSLESFAEQIANVDDELGFEQELYQEQMQRLHETAMAEDDVIRSLIDAGEPVSVDNILAQAEWMNHANATFNRIMSYAKKKEEQTSVTEEKIKEEIQALYENADQEEGIKASYNELIDTCKDMISKSMIDQTKSIDVKTMSLLHKQLTLAGSLAKEDDYQIPVYIGKELSVIHLKVMKGSKEGKVSVSMNSEKYGNISAEFEENENLVTGIIVGDDTEGVQKLSESEPRMKELLQKTGKEIDKLSFVHSKDLNKIPFGKEVVKRQTNETNTKSLYEVAKAFITAISEKNER